MKQETKIFYDIQELNIDRFGKWKYIIGEYHRKPCSKHGVQDIYCDCDLFTM